MKDLKKPLTKLAVLSSLIPGGLSATANASPVAITQVEHGGSGCPQGTPVKASLSHDSQILKLEYPGFRVITGEEYSRREGRKSCQLTVSLNYPTNLTYALVEYDTSGYAFLLEGTEAKQTVSYYFSNEPDDVTFEEVFKGPYLGGQYVTRDRIKQPPKWAPCHEAKPVNIKTAIRVSRDAANFPGSIGVLGAGKGHGSLKQDFGIIWKQCATPEPTP